MKNQKKYRGFTLFEVLVSIIILGIVMTSFPIIFQTMTGANKHVLREEVFFQEFTILSLINQRYFDEKNTFGDNFYKDLNATGGDTELFNNESSTFAGSVCRIGKKYFNNNILRSGSGDTTSAIGLDSGENSSDVSTYDDIDDFNDYNETFLSNTIHVNVKYINDDTNYSASDINFSLNYSSTANNTNIKLITIWAQLGDTNLTLRYPTCNIGASKFLSLEEITR